MGYCTVYHSKALQFFWPVIYNFLFHPGLYVSLQCSQRCGVGFQLRVVKCTYPNWKITKDENCDPNSKPNNKRYCQVKPCKTTTTTSDGNQTPSTTPASTTPREIPSWNEGSWSEVKKIVLFTNYRTKCCYGWVYGIETQSRTKLPSFLIKLSYRADPGFFKRVGE